MNFLGIVLLSLLLLQGVLLVVPANAQRPPKLFIAFLSRPTSPFRPILRATYLQGAHAKGVEYRFFVGPRAKGLPEVADENAKFGDIVYTDVDDNFKEKGSWRSLVAVKWALKNTEFDYFLRLDMDGYLCLDHLLADLKTRPLKQYFMGCWWLCVPDTRPDESFMLFTSDVAIFLAAGLWGEDSILRKRPDRTFDVNVGYHVHNSLNVTLFDDRARIGSQQNDEHLNFYPGETAPPRRFTAREDQLPGICGRFVYLHRIKNYSFIPVVHQHAYTGATHYDLPSMTSPPMCEGEPAVWKQPFHPRLPKPNKKKMIGKKH